MTNFVKITLVSLAVLAGASSANADTKPADLDPSVLYEEQSKYGF